MPRSSRIVILNRPHHVTQRGNNKTTTFIDDEDYAKYLSLFERFKTRYALDVISYTLMPNHVHFKAVPKQTFSLAKTFNYTQVCYTQYFNNKYNRVGHLWQSRFFSCPLDDCHCYSVSKYIELNPVRANLVSSPEQWKWSSTREHLGLEKGVITLSSIDDILPILNWEEYLQEGLGLSEIEKIDKHSVSGFPLGNRDFLKMVETLLGISLEKRPIGRPLIK